LVADVLTILYAALIIGWQITSLLREGSWPTLPLSPIINKLEFNRVAIFATASGGEIESSKLPNVIDTTLRVPAIVPLLLAAALLTAFYIWLTDLEKKYPGK
jgi:hypothetical protein